jgi:hypothetical protein
MIDDLKASLKENANPHSFLSPTSCYSSSVNTLSTRPSLASITTNINGHWFISQGRLGIHPSMVVPRTMRGIQEDTVTTIEMNNVLVPPKPIIVQVLFVGLSPGI